MEASCLLPFAPNPNRVNPLTKARRREAKLKADRVAQEIRDAEETTAARIHAEHQAAVAVAEAEAKARRAATLARSTEANLEADAILEAET